MANDKLEKNFYSFRARGVFGVPHSVRFGTDVLGLDKPKSARAGIYQRGLFGHRKETAKREYVKPTNPRTVPQQAWRAVFAAGRAAWAALTDEERARYNKRAVKRRYTGYNLFMSEYLYSHRL